MHRTVGELLDSISYEELLQWAEFEQRAPFSERAADFRSAQIAAIFANANRDPKKRPQPFEILDFMPFERAEQEKRKEYEAEQEKLRALEGEATELEEPKQLEDTETKINPVTVAWLFAMGRKKAAEQEALKDGSGRGQP